MIEVKKIQPFESKVWLSSPTMHDEELHYIQEAYDTNWMSTIGEKNALLNQWQMCRLDA